MSYLSSFERSFSQHTLAIVEEYDGKYDATLLINCLLGLLVVPKETMLDAIPETPLTELSKWGITPTSIKAPGAAQGRNDPNPETLRGLMFNLRHAVAHFRIKPVPLEGEVRAFEFRNDRGLESEVTVQEVREFVKRLSAHLKEQ
ncbi:HEPN family nuclease [Herbaspirillum sp. GCM10030257]|uniref:HEPN family nuclease n=1 Tax=Herbaspirillum sp. GCM10030257 TaxID=3273393 RepID=UPI0036109B9F